PEPVRHAAAEPDRRRFREVPRRAGDLPDVEPEPDRPHEELIVEHEIVVVLFQRQRLPCAADTSHGRGLVCYARSSEGWESRVDGGRLISPTVSSPGARSSGTALKWDASLFPRTRSWSPAFAFLRIPISSSTWSSARNRSMRAAMLTFASRP